MKDSLVLCYYGEILYNMKQYSKAILYFTKANIIDPENIHNLNKRAIAYYIIQEYDKVLLDLDKIIQLDPLNSSAYYLKSLTYYTKNDINNAKISFKKYAALLNSDNFLAKIHLSGLVLCSKNGKLRLDLPILHNHYYYYYIICKINVKKILSKDCFIKFIYNNEYGQSEHIDMLKHVDVSKLEGLGWIEYQNLKCNSYKFQLSIEINSIEMQIDYVRRGFNPNKITHIPGYLLPDYHQLFSNVPETFKDKYFSRKEMENLLDLNDILSIL
ncbi:TPR-like protein [Rhizophagus irregularis]|uniref:TPR-like protein n=1 Tax=Rhizophagus irregularis TaxID=588596 RepID=A0A2N0NI21_9GLOM|nr:TPR-like protein [Rhizophagus irregularis]